MWNESPESVDLATKLERWRKTHGPDSQILLFGRCGLVVRLRSLWVDDRMRAKRYAAAWEDRVGCRTPVVKARRASRCSPSDDKEGYRPDFVDAGIGLCRATCSLVFRLRLRSLPVAVALPVDIQVEVVAIAGHCIVIRTEQCGSAIATTSTCILQAERRATGRLLSLRRNYSEQVALQSRCRRLRSPDGTLLVVTSGYTGSALLAFTTGGPTPTLSSQAAAYRFGAHTIVDPQRPKANH